MAPVLLTGLNKIIDQPDEVEYNHMTMMQLSYWSTFCHAGDQSSSVVLHSCGKDLKVRLYFHNFLKSHVYFHCRQVPSLFQKDTKQISKLFDAVKKVSTFCIMHL